MGDKLIITECFPKSRSSRRSRTVLHEGSMWPSCSLAEHDLWCFGADVLGAMYVLGRLGPQFACFLPLHLQEGGRGGSCEARSEGKAHIVGFSLMRAFSRDLIHRFACPGEIRGQCGNH